MLKLSSLLNCQKLVEEIKVITYTGEGDISTDLLSPGTKLTKIGS
jgi:aconitase B